MALGIVLEKLLNDVKKMSKVQVSLQRCTISFLKLTPLQHMRETITNRQKIKKLECGIEPALSETSDRETSVDSDYGGTDFVSPATNSPEERSEEVATEEDGYLAHVRSSLYVYNVFLVMG